MTIPRIATLLTMSLVVSSCLAQGAPNGREPDAVSDEDRARIAIDALGDPAAHVLRSDGLLPPQGAAIYQLVMLGDAGTPVLIELLHSESPEVQHRALQLLGALAPTNALEALTDILWTLHETRIRDSILRQLARIDRDYTADVILASLDKTPPSAPSGTRCDLLARAGDIRVIPHLRPFLTGSEPYGRRRAAEMLARFGDPDAVTVLIELWESLDKNVDRAEREKISGTLSHSGDERAIPIALWTLRSNKSAISGSPLPREFGLRLVPHLLRGVRRAAPMYLEGLANALKAVHYGRGQEGWDGVPPSPEHVDLYGSALLDHRYATEPYGRSLPDAELRGTIAQALSSLGDEGRAYLRRGVHKPYAYAASLRALASYNDIEALHELAALATDASYPHRDTAVEAFASIAWLWQDAAEPYWLALLHDESIDVSSSARRHIARSRPTNAAALLTPLLKSEDPTVRATAQRMHTFYVERPGANPNEGLDIRVATDREAYGYTDDITLTIELTNGGHLPITIDTFLFDNPTYISNNLDLELVLPDGARRTYPNHGGGPDWARTTDYVRTLEPGDRIATHIDVRRHCRPAMPGIYRAQLAYGHSSQFRGQRSASPQLAPLVRSNRIEFRLAAPSRAHVDELVARLDIASLADESYAAIARICRTFGDLRDPSTIAALAALAHLPKHPRRVRNADLIRKDARKALAGFDTPALVPVWIELLDERTGLPAQQLGKLGDSRAIGPLRGRAFHSIGSGPGSVDGAAAAALSQLGDDSAMRFARRRALATMDPNDETTWDDGIEAFLVAMPGEGPTDLLRHEHPGVRSAAIHAAKRDGRVAVLAKALADTDARIRRQAMQALTRRWGVSDDEEDEPAIRIDALRHALADPELDVRRAAAIGLAEDGDDAGVSLLREDLHARDHATRTRARSALLKLHQYR
ncbi:hypothetical protein HN371_23715 [Candidatus Poribacteria bacterium]|jgi:HEAT repeat protein|nr:hypothetical protein [Candidatus Poribacteria bacterium]MBT5534569.1 hypothetical protein [Candidatus Poribacteria bacterium]MBT5710699.1 hypothetical protein [Candidatus Poribacteria bacterium]MBT7098222.1 hypothetical protein [Candidatus Poribacteria bacterium]MBT7806858.1 hypothetical protein [Candidatus Poribacteria bacterium]